MENVTSRETEAMRSAPPPGTENPVEGVGTKTTQTNQGKIEATTEPENAGGHSERQKPGRPDSAESETSQPRANGPEQASPSGPTSKTEPDGKIKRDFRFVTGMLLLSPLAAGESLDVYTALVEELYRAVKPQGIFDYVRLADIGHALWEEKRYRQQLVALPKATRFKALVALVIEVSPDYQIKASEIALDYFGADEERYAGAERLLRRYGITDDAITAQAHEMHGQTIGALERMVGHRQNLRNRAIKEVQRDQRKAEKKRTKPKREDGAGGATH
jgi:hypothetical protein